MVGAARLQLGSGFMSEKQDKKEQAKWKSDQIPAGAESAFLSTPKDKREKIIFNENEGDGKQSSASDGDGGKPKDAEIVTSSDAATDATLVNHRMDSMVGALLAKRYELKSFIGQGGMSVVYKATDLLLGKTVAVKLLLPHLVNDPITFQRFQLEARAASSLSHPNIVTIYDFGASENNEPFIVMDFLDGTPLNEAIKMLRGLALERSVAIFVQIADALQCAHSNNVLHRDLKPSNVLLIHQGPALDIVKLVDFGIAKLIPQDGGESLHLTKTGEVFGSPFYMSPEQCRGEKVDARSDIYSMGCLMYEVIAGKPPIVGANLMETLYRQLSEVPPSFSIACPDSRVPERLEAIVFKALHKDPAMRHQSMNELAAELHEFLNQMEAGWITNAKLKLELLRLKIAPFVGRERKLLWIAAAAVVVSGLVFLQYLSIYFKDTREPPPGAAAAWSLLEKPPMERDDFARNVSFIRKNLSCYAKAEGQDSYRYIEGLKILATTYERSGHFREAVLVRNQVYEKLKEVDGESADDTLEAQWTYAKILGKNGDSYESVAVYQDLFNRLAKADDVQDPNRMPKPEAPRHQMFNAICESLANALYANGKFEEAASKYETLLLEYKKFRETRNTQTPRRAAIYCRLADCYRLRGKYEAAEKAYEEALRIWTDSNQDTASLIATTRLLGFVHFQQGHYKRARYLYEEALPKMESELGESSPEVIAALREYSQLMWKKGNYITSVITDLRVKELQSKRQRTG